MLCKYSGDVAAIKSSRNARRAVFFMPLTARMMVSGLTSILSAVDILLLPSVVNFYGYYLLGPLLGQGIRGESSRSTPPCRPSATLPKERGPVETVPGRKTETDRVPEGISEGFRPAQSGGVAPRGREPGGQQGSAVFSEVSRMSQEARDKLRVVRVETVKRFAGFR